MQHGIKGLQTNRQEGPTSETSSSDETTATPTSQAVFREVGQKLGWASSDEAFITASSKYQDADLEAGEDVLNIEADPFPKVTVKNALSRPLLREILQHDWFHRTVIGLVIFEYVTRSYTAIRTPEPNESHSSSTPEGRQFILGGPEPGPHSTNLTTTAASSSKSPDAGFCQPNLKLTPQIESLLDVFFWISVSILILFTIEITLSLYAFGIKFLKSFLHALDAFVVIASLVLELYLHLSGRTDINANAIIILRIWKVIRAMHAIAHSIQLKAQRVVKSLKKVNHEIKTESESMHRLLQFQHQRIHAISARLHQRKRHRMENADEISEGVTAPGSSVKTVGDVSPIAAPLMAEKEDASSEMMENELGELASEIQEIVTILDIALREEEGAVHAAVDKAIQVAARGTIAATTDEQSSSNPQPSSARSQIKFFESSK
ncbi:hypothetical protein HDU97_007929 [Phlyctochytrium planicorne]|nr:hypothetical protein HDU97_007929 [Phlyctochytrium planicorne]